MRVLDTCLLGKGAKKMRRVVLVLALVGAMLVAASGMALAVNEIGTNGPDTLKGTNGSDNLLGRGGNDVLYGFAGRDNLLGAEGKDWILGGDERGPLGGDKNLVGGGGNDAILGGDGSDNPIGGPGNDFIDGGFGSDKITGGDGTDYLLDGEIQGGATDLLTGGDGNDVLDVINRPAKRDIVTCGNGFDRVIADTEDLVAPDCEKVAVGFAAAERLNLQLGEAGFFDRIFGGLAPSPI
jgi:RTX calcium-binding nonapeptide repeat (4 copies)